tara:strand:- start:248 stop:649 length:402 start_codon:yes stop_codon:yes gene_type:complete
MANGTIAFDTLSTSGQISGTAVSVDADYLAYGSAKMWINFNGKSTIAIRDSFNNTSITDDGTGSYTITINNDMANANYCTTSGLGRAGLATCTFINDSSWAATTGSGAVICANNSNAAFDPPAVLASFLGDLA